MRTLLLAGSCLLLILGSACKKGDDAKGGKNDDEARKAKTVEAIDNLDRIYKAAATYYTTPMVSQEGMKLPCQFPASQAMTPDVSGKKCCGGEHDSDKDNRCDGNQTLWDTPTWNALLFQLDEPHYFGYSFESSGTLGDAAFTATAYADLDCDGTLSTFQRFGYGEPSASSAECSMKSPDEMKVEKELE